MFPAQRQCLKLFLGGEYSLVVERLLSMPRALNPIPALLLPQKIKWKEKMHVVLWIGFG